jgi:predicted DNA-binding transcriptional regulator AlpA
VRSNDDSSRQVYEQKPIAPPVNGGRLLTPDDVAEITGLSTETLAQWRSQRRGIPFLKISRNFVRYRQRDLDLWLADRLISTEGRNRT